MSIALISRAEFSKLQKENPQLLKEKIFKIVKDQGVRYVNLQFIDVTGIMKAVTIPIAKLADAINDNVWFNGVARYGYMVYCSYVNFINTLKISFLIN
jgi:hypothetical protein